MPAGLPGAFGDSSARKKPSNPAPSLPGPPVQSPAEEISPAEEKLSLWKRLRRVLFGAPRSLADQSLFHKLSLIPFLAWVGLGADGLSSSAYGPDEAFRTLGQHTYLTAGLAFVMASTVSIISLAYSHIIERFPHGGGGYLVASQLLGPRVGVVSGAALVVDYILTITVSIAAAGDALFSFLPLLWHGWKLPVEILLIVWLVTANIRGVRESVLMLAPIFLVFIATHVVLIGGGIAFHAADLPALAESVSDGFQGGLATLGAGGMFLLLIHAFSLGGGTYTGIEAVSNGIPIMREPRVQTAKRTMLYMGSSLAFTATGLLIGYLLWKITPAEGMTLNAVLASAFARHLPFGEVFVILVLVSEGALLVVAAQAGFIDGPRVLANMAVDSWMPHRFSALSDRLTTQNGIVLMGVASLAALLYTLGDVRHIVVMYSINVFLTFSLSLGGMAIYHLRARGKEDRWVRRAALFTTGFVLCATILAFTIMEKFFEGGWITILVTGSVVFLSFLIRRHYNTAAAQIAKLPEEPGKTNHLSLLSVGEIDPRGPTAAVLVASYGKLGIRTVRNIFKGFPGHFKNMVFLTVGVVDSGAFKGGGNALESLQVVAEETGKKYVSLANRHGVPAAYRVGMGIDVAEEAEKLCLSLAGEFPHVTFFSGKLVFERERWHHRFLHNETAFAVQRRLQWAGQTMVILPVVVER